MSVIKKPHELKGAQSVRILIYGQPGIGKTTAGISAPSPLLIDFDGGAHRVRAQHLCDTVPVGSWDDVISLLGEDLNNYKTLVIDTAGKMLDFMAQKIIKDEPKKGRADGMLTLQGFGTRRYMFQNFVSRVSTMGKHLVFVAHEKEERDGDTKIIRPEIGGSSSGDLIKELDLVGYMEAQGKIRTISFDPCEKFYGKNTCGIDNVVKLPDVTKSPNDYLTTVVQKFTDESQKRAQMSVDYQSVMDGVRTTIEGIQGAEVANAFIKEVDKIDHVWDSKIQASHLLKKKCAELGLVFDKTKRAYVEPHVAPKPAEAATTEETARG